MLIPLTSSTTQPPPLSSPSCELPGAEEAAPSAQPPATGVIQKGEPPLHAEALSKSFSIFKQPTCRTNFNYLKCLKICF